MPKEPSSRPAPTISRVLPDGTMIELLYDADKGETALVHCPPSGTPTLQSQINLTEKECLVPYAPGNNLLTSGCVLLPSSVGDYTDKAACSPRSRRSSIAMSISRRCSRTSPRIMSC